MPRHRIRRPAGHRRPRGSARGQWLAARGRMQAYVTGDLASGRAAEWTAGRRDRGADLAPPAASADEPRRPRSDSAGAAPAVPPGRHRQERGAVVVERGPLVGRGGRRRPAARARSAVGRHNLGDQQAAIVTAILIGDRAGLSDEIERRLQIGRHVSRHRDLGRKCRAAGRAHDRRSSAHCAATSGGRPLALIRRDGLWLGRRRRSIGAASGHRGRHLPRRARRRPRPARGPRAVSGRGSRRDDRSADGARRRRVAVLWRDPRHRDVRRPIYGHDLTAAAVKRTCEAAARSGLALLGATLAAELALLPIGAAVFSRVSLAGTGPEFRRDTCDGVVQLAGMLVVVWDVSWPAGVARCAARVASVAAAGSWLRDARGRGAVAVLARAAVSVRLDDRVLPGVGHCALWPRGDRTLRGAGLAISRALRRRRS